MEVKNKFNIKEENIKNNNDFIDIALAIIKYRKKKIGTLKRYFRLLRFSKKHIGLGDIRLTIGMQDKIIKYLEG